MAVAVVLTACRGEKTTRTAPATSLPAEVVAARAVAEQAVLRQADFPAGWTATPHVESPADPDLERHLSDCLGVDVSAFGDNPASVDSPDFELNEPRLEVRNSVRMNANAEDARAKLTVFDRPEMAGCLTTVVSRQVGGSLENLGSGSFGSTSVSLGQVSAERLPLGPLGEGTVGYRVAVPLEVDGRQATFSADFVVALKGRASTMFTFLGLGSPFPADLALGLTQIVVGRLPPS